jgi:hypothetical protein
VSSPAPLLDFFRRGEAAREIRLLAAQGALAPRAHEQLGILILLVDDRDQEIRDTARHTLDRIPVEALRGYLGRSDVPVGMREFFADRGVFPAEMPAITADGPLFDVTVDPAAEAESLEGETDETMLQKLQKMNITDRMKAAMRGSRDVRAVLIRDPNKIVAAAVLSSPKVSESEVETFAKMATVSEDVLRTIGMNRGWLKNYGIVVALTKNPKCPVGLSLNLLNRLNERDLSGVSTDRNVPDPLRTAARRKMTMGSKG